MGRLYKYYGNPVVVIEKGVLLNCGLSLKARAIYCILCALLDNGVDAQDLQKFCNFSDSDNFDNCLEELERFGYISIKRD